MTFPYIVKIINWKPTQAQALCIVNKARNIIVTILVLYIIGNFTVKKILMPYILYEAQLFSEQITTTINTGINEQFDIYKGKIMELNDSSINYHNKLVDIVDEIKQMRNCLELQNRHLIQQIKESDISNDEKLKRIEELIRSTAENKYINNYNFDITENIFPHKKK